MIQLISSALAISVYLIAIFSIPQMGGVIPLMVGVVLFERMFDISWLFSGKENFKKITLRNTVVRLVGVICIFTFIKSSDGLYLYIF